MEFNRFYRFDELTAALHQAAAAKPGLIAVESAGRSHEGRDVWVATLTNGATGPAAEKPGFWVGGNVHATELSASTACLYLIDRLLSRYGTDPDITRLLDTRALYICPRISPDGAEWAMAEPPRPVRSSTRPYPFAHDREDGLVEQDIDGDGRILMMRIADPNGAWKPHPVEQRLMIRRDPIETGGTYYRILPEGRIENYDGVQIPIALPRHGLDLNRNYPANWRQEHEQPGAGPFPTSEPEIRAVVDFVSTHPNITGGIDFHTYSGVLLRPYSDKPDADMPPEDLWIYQTIGAKGSEMTGYPAISIHHEFRYHPNQVISGGFDWLFTHQGAFMWAVEIWSPQKQAGITDYKYIDWFRDHPVEDDLKLLAWSDTALDGKGYIDWYPVDHPELGPIELGGWDAFHAFRNPPPQFLENEVAKFPDWVVWHALISPRLELFHAAAHPLGADNWRIELVVHNTGWLPSYVSKTALKAKITQGVQAEITLAPDCTLTTGSPHIDGPEAEGRANLKTLIGFGRQPHGTPDRVSFEWWLHGPEGAEIQLTARHDRAGTVRTVIELGGVLGKDRAP
jgi:murein tripeptide amidase MpaA